LLESVPVRTFKICRGPRSRWYLIIRSYARSANSFKGVRYESRRFLVSSLNCELICAAVPATTDGMK